MRAPHADFECVKGKNMRSEIIELLKLGPFPHEDLHLDSAVVDRYAELIAQITRPVTDEEACILVGLFGDDDFFGVAWSLLHLIETAPKWPLEECLQNTNNEWVQRLRDRVENAKKIRACALAKISMENESDPPKLL